MRTPTIHQRNKAKARLNRALIPVLAQISARVQQASDERHAIALFRLTNRKPVATLQQL